MRMTACTYEICPPGPNCADSSISANPEAWLFLQMGASQPLAVFVRACIFCVYPSEFRDKRRPTTETSGLSNCHQLRRFLGHTENPLISDSLQGTGKPHVFWHPSPRAGNPCVISESWLSRRLMEQFSSECGGKRTFYGTHPLNEFRKRPVGHVGRSVKPIAPGPGRSRPIYWEKQSEILIAISRSARHSADRRRRSDRPSAGFPRR